MTPTVDLRVAYLDETERKIVLRDVEERRRLAAYAADRANYERLRDVEERRRLAAYAADRANYERLRDEGLARWRADQAEFYRRGEPQNAPGPDEYLAHANTVLRINSCTRYYS